MHTRTVTFLAPLLLAALAPAQKKPKGGTQEPPKVEAPKDDAITAKDPAIVALDKFVAKHQPSGKSPGWRRAVPQAPKVSFTPDRDYLWHMGTNKGPIVIRLDPETAPLHVGCAIALVRLGYYDELAFHRVIQGFMAQGGCPEGNGTGAPGYYLEGEFSPAKKHDKLGLLSAANQAGNPKSDGSQFFLTFVPTPHLDGKHTIYGEVVEGMETLKALEAAGSESGAPKEPLVLQRNWIRVAERAAKPAKDAGGPEKGDKKGD